MSSQHIQQLEMFAPTYPMDQSHQNPRPHRCFLSKVLLLAWVGGDGQPAQKAAAQERTHQSESESEYIE